MRILEVLRGAANIILLGSVVSPAGEEAAPLGGCGDAEGVEADSGQVRLGGRRGAHCGVRSGMEGCVAGAALPLLLRRTALRRALEAVMLPALLLLAHGELRGSFCEGRGG